MVASKAAGTEQARPSPSRRADTEHSTRTWAFLGAPAPCRESRSEMKIRIVILESALVGGGGHKSESNSEICTQTCTRQYYSLIAFFTNSMSCLSKVATPPPPTQVSQRGKSKSANCLRPEMPRTIPSLRTPDILLKNSDPLQSERGGGQQ